MAWLNLRPESWRAFPGWDLTWYVMVSAMLSCLVLQDLVRYASTSSVGSSCAGTFYWLQVRVVMGSGVVLWGVPRITY